MASASSRVLGARNGAGAHGQAGTYEAIELLKRARASIYKHKTLTIALATIEADRRMVGASSIRTRSGEFGVDGPPAIGA